MNDGGTDTRIVVETSRPVRYAVLQGDVLGPEAAAFPLFCGRPGERRLVVIDERVDGLHGESLRRSFAAHHVTCRFHILRGGEANKTADALMGLLHEMDALDLLRRSEPLIAIGGGVVLDVAGLAASLYRRGIPYVRIPTTLVGAVDVAIAAKTGINFRGRRNRLGTYFPPALSVIDRRFFDTLSEREVRSGLAEILKIALIRDGHLFECLEEGGDRDCRERLQGAQGGRIVEGALRAMKGELQPNLWEEELARLADFGHTFSPLLEMLTEGGLSHGEAVILDVQLSCALACGLGLLSNPEFRRVIATVRRLGLPTSHPLFSDASLLRRAWEDTRRHRDGRPVLPLPRGIGRGTCVDAPAVDLDLAVAAWAAVAGEEQEA